MPGQVRPDVFSARDLARAGINVTIFEKSDYNILGHNWSDAVERAGLSEAGFELPPKGNLNTGPLVKSPGEASSQGRIFEQHSFPEMDIWSPDYSTKKIIDFRYITTDRRALGMVLADQAREAGATIKFKHEVIDIILSEGDSLETIMVKGIKMKDLSSGEINEYNCDMFADCTGFNDPFRVKLPESTCITRKYDNEEFAPGIPYSPQKR